MSLWWKGDQQSIEPNEDSKDWTIRADREQVAGLSKARRALEFVLTAQ